MERQQCDKIGDTFSDWVSENGGMPQGTSLGRSTVCVFLLLIDDLKSLLELHKSVDYCSLTEIIKELNTSKMQAEIDSVDSCSNMNHMNTNIKKTEEILCGSIIKNLPRLLQLNYVICNMLGLHVTALGLCRCERM